MNIWSCICLSLTCIPFNSNIVGEKEHLIINENKNIELQINSGVNIRIITEVYTSKIAMFVQHMLNVC